MPPAKSLRGYMDTGRKRDIIDGWLAAAMVWAQKLVNGPKDEWAECVRASLIYARAICKLSKCVRDCENFNNNLRIRAHVLASVEGKAWARDVLGEDNIKRWQNRYDACRKAGWLPEKKTSNAKPTPRTTPKSYNWKPIALPRISEMFFKPIDFTFAELPDPFAKQLFAWARERRVLSPAIFWPFELEDDYTPEPNNNNKPVPGLDPGSSAPPAKSERSALNPGSSPGPETGREKPP